MVQNIRSVSHGVGAQTKVVVRVCSPEVSLEWGSGVEGDMEGPVADQVVQSGEPIVVHKCRVGALAEEEDKSAQLAVKSCAMERRVTTLCVFPVQRRLLLSQQPLWKYPLKCGLFDNDVLTSNTVSNPLLAASCKRLFPFESLALAGTWQ